LNDVCLVTGGAGFIGTHVANLLKEQGRTVRVLDSFDPQVHGTATTKELPGVELITGDAADPGVWDRALDGVGSVIHLAAAVGVGQSMYEITHYCRANVMGTAELLEAMLSRREQIGRLIVASSMSIYGEGTYLCPSCNEQRVLERKTADVAAGHWDPLCPVCGTSLQALPTNEDKPLRARSVYAVNKRDQEEMCLAVGRAIDIPTLALRFFNVYGPGQALSNPYTGVGAIFASRLLAGRPALVFEDGEQSRDFIHVSDIARAVVTALDRTDVSDVALNVGTGRSISVNKMEELLRERLGGPDPQILGSFREGDIRHCFADVSAIQEQLGWKAEVPLETGIEDLVSWVKTQTGDATGADGALNELLKHNLVRSKE